ncbi:glycosyltransferase [Plantibacter sp. PA-3-X8]|uniref:glycosyltransferase n=1 Tax=Plantibacter sp. PA-3-X8 TaxID=2480625 RepID=UPI000F5E7A0D|nr:glycosyltransferase [Plantibacter sp. PA-3-X8]AZH84681.1 glycosyltransferase [Plantibacter sp. PA-3-X8]
MTQKPIARYYRGARTTHLERLHDSAPGDFFYQKPMYDFDVTRAPAGVRVEQTSFVHIAALVLKGTYSRLEIVEPYAPSALPQNLVLSVAARVGRLLRRQPTQLVTYAIENADLPRKVAASTHLPVAVTRALLRLTVGFCYRSLTRIVFGTADAETNYEALLGARMKRRPPETTLIWGLPTAHPSALTVDSDEPASKVLFVGALDERKGIRQLMDSWSNVLASSPNAELQILGKGPLEAEVLRWAQTAPRTTVIIDPARDVIFEAQRHADVAVLLSQPFTNWKEQIGLPIVEGLSVGTEIVASTETGIAEWLQKQGHKVLSPTIKRAELASAIAGALEHRRTREEIRAELPPVDGRLDADRWLFTGDMHEKTGS